MRDNEDEEQCKEDSIAGMSSDGERKQTYRNTCARGRTTRAPMVRPASLSVGAIYMHHVPCRG
jgi:hypothetical protein